MVFLRTMLTPTVSLILIELEKEDMAVRTIMQKLRESEQSHISQQLSKLRNIGVVSYYKIGKEHYYTLNKELLSKMHILFSMQYEGEEYSQELLKKLYIRVHGLYSENRRNILIQLDTLGGTAYAKNIRKSLGIEQSLESHSSKTLKSAGLITIDDDQYIRTIQRKNIDFTLTISADLYSFIQEEKKRLKEIDGRYI